MNDLDHECTARRDPRVWLLVLVGAGFVVAGFSIAPATNCSPSGDCAPWLVWLTRGLGALALLGGLWQLIDNPRRGCRIDTETGDLIWWQNRSGARSGLGGRIAPARIHRIDIRNDREGPDALRLFDERGQVLPWFDAEVVPPPPEAWAQRLAARYPHILVEVSA